MQPSTFYPIVPDDDWVERLVPLGVRTIQLRIKDVDITDRADRQNIAGQVRKSLKICAQHGCQLIVNDYWEIALQEGADYIHLGQEDLAKLPEDGLSRIRAAGIRLGLSSHSTEELKIALAARPDYIALGPVWETLLKKMKWAPQGLEKLGYWKTELTRQDFDCPLVAIGGITPQRAPLALEAGADSIAVVTDFLTHETPELRVQTWLDLLEAPTAKT